jgi:hypothetical protein
LDFQLTASYHILSWQSCCFDDYTVIYVPYFSSFPCAICEGICGTLVITSNRGLLSPETIVSVEDLRLLNRVDIDYSEKRFTRPLRESATQLARTLPVESNIVLLGSIGTKKYAEPLTEIFQERLHFPSDFIGRGDMSRGGLLLRCVESNNELNYIPVVGAVRHGKRPPKLEPKRR